MKKSKLFAFILILISIQLLESSCMNFKLSESKNRGISQKSLSKSELLKSLAIYKGSTIEGIDFEGRARLEAKKILIEKFDKDLDKKINFIHENISIPLSLRDMGFSYDYDEKTWEAFNLGRSGSEEVRLELINSISKKPIDRKLSLIIDDEKLSQSLEKIAENVRKDPVQNGYTYDFELDKIIAKEGEGGYQTDLETLKAIINEKKDSLSDIVVPTKELTVNPDSQKIADSVNTVIGSGETSFNAGFWERAENIRVSSEALNGYVIGPGETFSFNGVIGDTTSDKGYQEAIVLVGTKEVPGMGGGVCQTSTTLYHAALKAGLEIIERHPHTMLMSYSRGGLDAAIENGLIDLVLRNPYDFPVLIKSYYEPGTVYFNILGDPNKANTYSIYSEFISETPFKEEDILDNSLEPGEKKVKVWGVNGSGYAAYRENDKTGEDQYLGDTWYPVINQVNLVGREIENTEEQVEGSEE